MISVIVSVYNQPLTLKCLLSSLKRQDYPHDWEVLVCDDGSNEEILSTIRNSDLQNDLDLRYIWQPEIGFRLARSRNNAIRCSKGDLLVFLDGDMIVKPDFLSLHAAAHDKDRLLICGSRARVAIDDDSPLKKNISDVLSYCERHGRIIENHYQKVVMKSELPWRACFGCMLSVDKRDDVYFDETFTGWGMEDWEFACRLSNYHSYTIVYSESIKPFHIEKNKGSFTSRSTLHGGHDEIVSFIRNALYFQSKYKDIDMTLALELILQFKLDSNNRWYRVPKWNYGGVEDIKQALDFADVWMRDYGLQ